jgi:hypothetical protein
MTTLQEASQKYNAINPTTDRNPRSISDRRSHQCARPGWSPHKIPVRRLAELIADSIRQHRAAGDLCWTQPSEFTPHAETQALVLQLLSADTTPQP